jgi:hypothetical protein
VLIVERLVIVGREASAAMRSPDRTAVCIKREMGAL